MTSSNTFSDDSLLNPELTPNLLADLGNAETSIGIVSDKTNSPPSLLAEEPSPIEHLEVEPTTLVPPPATSIFPSPLAVNNVVGNSSSNSVSISNVNDLDLDTLFPHPEPLVGDADGDCDLDFDDVRAISAARGETATDNDVRDLDDDGVISVLDARRLVVTLRRNTDFDAPVVGLGLANDTGISSDDGITQEFTVSGQIDDASPVTSIKAGFDDTAPEDYVKIVSVLGDDGSFELNQTQLTAINRGELAQGEHTLYLEVKDKWANEAETVAFNFTLDTVAPELTLGLTPNSDTGELGDNITTESTIDIVGQTEPGSTVTVAGTDAEIIADENGDFTFTEIALEEGANEFSFTATDLAGNQTTNNITITREIISNGTPPVLDAELANDTGADQTDGLTTDPTITGLITTDASINILEASINGNDFIDVSSGLGENNTFALGIAEYEALTANLPNGEYDIALRATDSNGLTSNVDTVNFTLDTTEPDITLELAADSDTGEQGDNTTTERVVTLQGTTDPGLPVVLVQNQQQTVADSEGNFSFTDVFMPVAGTVPFTVVTTDEAGNQGRATQNLTREGINGAPTITSSPELVFDAENQDSYSYQVEAVDPDGDDLNYILLDAPTDAVIDENGLISFTQEIFLESSYEFTVQVDDGRGGSDTQTFTVDVVSDNLGTIKGIKWEDLNGNGERDNSLVISSLSGDWSDSENPNTVWSLNEGNNALIPISNDFWQSRAQTNFPTPQSFWSVPSVSEYLPVWFQFKGSVKPGLDQLASEGLDILEGDVIVHTTDNANGQGFGLANVTWTSTIDSTVDISGAVWMARDIERGNRWTLYLNDVPLTTGEIFSGDPFDRDNPFFFDQGTAGSSVLDDLSVSIGDVLKLEFEKTSTFGDFVGVELDISSNELEPGLAGVTVYLDTNNNGILDPDEPVQITAEDDPSTPDIDETGQYEFNNLVAGTYTVREVVPEGFEQTFPTSTEVGVGDGFADVILDYFNSGAGTFDEPYGVNNDGIGPVIVDTDIILGGDTQGSLALPIGSSVTVGFTDEIIVDGEGNDIFIPELGAAGERAEVFVSSDLQNFTFLGIGNGGQTSVFDLANIGFTEPVRAIKIVGLDNRGSVPGFDVINVQGLPNSIASPDFYTVELAEGEVVENIDFGNAKVDTGTIKGIKWDDIDGNGDRSFDSNISRNNGTAVFLPSETAGEGYVKLTEANRNQFGAIFTENSIDLVDSNGDATSFSTQFQFSLTNPGGLRGGGDRLILMITQDNTPIRYNSLDNSVGIEFDSYNNGAIDDNSDNHVGILLNGSGDAIAQTTVSPSFLASDLWNVWVDYNGETQILEVRASIDDTRPLEPTVSTVVDIPSILDREEAYIGIAGSTGGAWAEHNVFSWDLQVNSSEGNQSFEFLPAQELEPGLAGVTVYLDSNNNEVLDPGEPFQVTADDDPSTPNIDETGQYEFNNLEAGTYIVREVVPDGYIQTAPINTTVANVFDGEFEEENWSVDYFAFSGTPDLEADSDQYQRLDDGNPDAHREMIHTWNSGGGIIYHRYEDYTYDPSIQGAFDTVDYLEDQRAFVRGVVGRGMVVFQDGDIFRTTPDLVFSAFGNSTWQTWALSDIQESDFISATTGNNPDFSANGSPMQFGYWRSNSRIGGQTIRHGIDNWSVTLLDTSTDSYRVNLDAGETVENIDFGNALIGSVNVAPRIVSQPINTAFTGVPYQYNVAAIDRNGDELTYTLLNAPEGMVINNQGVITWDTGAIGIYDVEIQVDDGRGGIVTQAYELNVTAVPVDDEAPNVNLGFSGTVFEIGETLNLQIAAIDNVGLADLDLTFNGESLTLDPDIADNGVINTAAVTLNEAGVFEVVATATDFAGNTDTETLSVRAIDPSDTSAPVAELDISGFDPLNLVIDEKTDIIGTVNDENLEFYRVDIAPVSLIDLNNPAANNPNYITVAEGTGNVDNGVLATIDPNLYRNDSYYIRIYTQDFNGNVNVEGIVAGINSQNKPGEFSLEFTDLSVPVAGVPIEITRRYSSLDASFEGDFGFGWELGLQDAEIVEAAPDGRNLSFDSFFGGNSFTVGTRVTLTTPDGRRVGFTFDPVIDGGGFLGARYAPRFVPDPGVYETLEVPDFPLSLNGDGSVGLYLFGFTYNPSQYTLTTKDGTKYNYNQNQGLQTVEDRNGNTLTFSDDGIESSTGVEIDFVRDGQGRITEIVDPEGESLVYDYDANGDLVGFTDREDNQTTFLYEGARPHYLTELIDPLGRTGVRTEYDENGQISKIFDADGNFLDINYDSAASQQTITDPFGNITTLVFDERGNFVSRIDALGGVTAFTYDDDNNLLTETDPEGNITTRTYDDRGNVLTETDGEGNTTTFTYNANNDVLTETDALGNVTTNTYDENGNLITRKDAEGNVTTYDYGLYSLLTGIIDAEGNESVFDYNNRGYLTQLNDPSGTEYTFTYDNSGKVLSLTNDLEQTFTLTYDNEGRQTSATNPEGNTSFTEYDAFGDVIAEIDELGRRTEFIYNDRGLLIGTIYPDSTPNPDDNPRILNNYNELDQLISTTDELGRVTRYEYDALQRLVKTIYPDAIPNDLTDNPFMQTEYYADGLVSAEIDELGNRTEFEYDRADNLILQRDALGNEISFEYDAVGNQTAIIDANGNRTEFIYDGLQQLIETKYADGTVEEQVYSPLGYLTEVIDQAGVSTKYEYDALGRLTKVIDALEGETEYIRDTAGNILQQIDANNQVVTFTYDDLNRVSTNTLPLGQVESTTYDAVGNIKTTTDYNGVVTTYEYDERNRFSSRSYSDGTPTESFTYTLTGQLATVTDNRGATVFEYDTRDRLISRTEPDGRKIEYIFDAAGNILSLITESGVTAYTYDVLNRIDTVTDADNTVTDYDYDAVGNLTTTTFGNGVTENRDYDSLNRLIYLENVNNDGVISSFAYTLDDVGNRIRIEEEDGRITEYEYDLLYRLTEESVTDTVNGNFIVEYVYDAVGNRLQKVDSVNGTTTYVYDDNDRLLSETTNGVVTQYDYDNAGNLITKLIDSENQTTYEWNAKGELIAVEATENGSTGRIEYEYDHEGIRVAINIDGEETRFLIDKNQQEFAQVIEEYLTSGEIKNSYVHGWDLISQDDGTERVYYHVDGLGSTRNISDINSSVVVEYTFDAYGNLINQVGDTDSNYLFTGEQFDNETGLNYNRARYYDPNTGRFISRDPFEGFNSQPVTLQDYLYGNANPIIFIDPSGETSLTSYYKASVQGLQIADIAFSITASAVLNIVSYQLEEIINFIDKELSELLSEETRENIETIRAIIEIVNVVQNVFQVVKLLRGFKPIPLSLLELVFPAINIPRVPFLDGSKPLLVFATTIGIQYYLISATFNLNSLLGRLRR